MNRGAHTGGEAPDPREVGDTLGRVRLWAEDNDLPLNHNRRGFQRLDDALFVPLDPLSREQFEEGAGGELRRMHSLRSSSALAYNVFAPWKPHPTPIAELLGGVGSYDQLNFETKFPTGVSSHHPHLDVTVEGGHVPLAVESKFLEIYDDPKSASFSPRYLDADGLWKGLEGLRHLGEELSRGDADFVRLGAAQLIKHILGLAREYGPDGFQLVYLWYEVPGAAADKHRHEVERFTNPATSSIRFVALTYQELYRQLLSLEEPAPGYLGYLEGRYF